MPNYKSLFISAAALISFPSHSFAQATSSTPYSSITTLVGGWNAPDTFVQLSGQAGASITNPGACPTTDGYQMAGSDSYSQLLSSMLLTAYTAQLNIQLVISGCFGGRPHIIGLALHR
jgi:hypothetical protein